MQTEKSQVYNITLRVFFHWSLGDCIHCLMDIIINPVAHCVSENKLPAQKNLFVKLVVIGYQRYSLPLSNLQSGYIKPDNNRMHPIHRAATNCKHISWILKHMSTWNMVRYIQKEAQYFWKGTQEIFIGSFE